MNLKRFVLMLFPVVFLFTSLSGNQEIENFPDFICESSKGEMISEDYLRANNIRIIIYGTPKALKKNRNDLDRVLELIKSIKLEDQLLYIVNFSSFPKILKNQIKRTMGQNSIALGVKIYAEWNGSIYKGFSQSFREEEVSVFLIGKDYEIEERMTDLSSENTIEKIIEIQPQTDK